MKKQPEHSKESFRRLKEIKIEPLVKFSPARWDDMVKESEKKRKHFDKLKSTRHWGEWRELRGLVAEEVVASVTGIPRNRKIGGDGGTDFFKTDVKGIPPVNPVLAVVPKDGNNGPLRWIADYYLVVVVDIRERWGTPFGWATRDEVRYAPLVKMPNALSHVLYPWQLHEGLPPELAQYSKLMRGLNG